MFSGARTMWRDYFDSWTSESGEGSQWRAGVYFFLPPSLASVPFFVWRIEIPNVSPYLTATTVFTALLFGLLFLVFNLAVTLRKDGSAINSAHNLRELVEDMRATITYTIAVAVVLVIALTVAATLLSISSPGPLSGYGWLWTPILVWLGVHLGLNVLKILQRFRTAFNYISR